MIINYMALSFLAAVFSSDITMFGQFMISRPIFCGPFFGFLLGDIHTGLWLGMIVEMVWINAIPLGCAVPVDLTFMTILSVIWSTVLFRGSQEIAVFALALAVPFAYIYKEVDFAGRLFNTKVMHWVEHGIKNGKEKRISKGLFFGLLFFILRTALMYFLFLLLGSIIIKKVFATDIPIYIVLALKKAWYYLPVFGFGMVLNNFKNIKIPFIKR
ncbi:PTS sugar transporter subunit IIC [Candidatus Ruminimicrobium bovinum]|uniref:PTS sugar transporter subunit IIC n=1 Tax=Candidatus Ruminimicrobium bovinum TaxID=3242779 RepID=UPI0039B9C1B6